MKFFNLIVLTALAWNVSAKAEDCSSIDVRESLPADVKTFLTTPSDQGDTGWCYGYAATDLVSQAIGTPVSALHLSTYYSSQIGFWGKLGRAVTGNGGTTPQGGFLPTAIHEIADLGYACKEKDLPSKGTYDVWLSSQTKVEAGMSALIYSLQQFRKNQCDLYCDKKIEQLTKDFFPAISAADLKKYVRNNSRVKLEDAIFNFADSQCRYKAVPLKNTRLEYSTYLKPARIGGNIVQAIDAALDRRRLVGMEYNAAYITNVGGNMGASHASTIVGRKKIGGVCHYLVRNSWGDTCDYRASVICVKNQGSYWVPAETLERMIVRATWLN